jgi:hypothetical protein
MPMPRKGLGSALLESSSATSSVNDPPSLSKYRQEATEQQEQGEEEPEAAHQHATSMMVGVKAPQRRAESRDSAT